MTGRHPRGPYDAAKAAADVAALGGFGPAEIAHLDTIGPTERRETLKNWYGYHGGRWAWEQYQQQRAAGGTS